MAKEAKQIETFRFLSGIDEIKIERTQRESLAIPIRQDAREFRLADKPRDRDGSDGAFDEDEDDEEDDAQTKFKDLNFATWNGIFEMLAWLTYGVVGMATTFASLGGEVGVTALLAKFGLTAFLGVTAGGAAGVAVFAIPAATYFAALAVIKLFNAAGKRVNRFFRGMFTRKKRTRA